MTIIGAPLRGPRVYFIQMDVNGPIKIGVTENEEPVNTRLPALQTGNPYRLILLGEIEGGYRREAAIHQLLSEHRLNGEWFAAVPFVVETVSAMLDDSFDWNALPNEDVYTYRPRAYRPQLTVAISYPLAARVIAAANEVGITPTELIFDVLADAFPARDIDAFVKNEASLKAPDTAFHVKPSSEAVDLSQ